MFTLFARWCGHFLAATTYATALTPFARWRDPRHIYVPSAHIRNTYIQAIACEHAAWTYVLRHAAHVYASGNTQNVAIRQNTPNCHIFVINIYATVRRTSCWTCRYVHEQLRSSADLCRMNGTLSKSQRESLPWSNRSQTHCRSYKLLLPDNNLDEFLLSVLNLL